MLLALHFGHSFVKCNRLIIKHKYRRDNDKYSNGGKQHKRISQLQWLLGSTVSVSGYVTGKRDLILKIQVFRDVTLRGWESGCRKRRHYSPLKLHDYTSENMAQFRKRLVRAQNVAEVTVAPLIRGTQTNILNKNPNISHSAHK